MPDEFLTEAEVEMYHNDIAGLIDPRGVCVNYLQLDDECPPPVQPISLLCSSVYDQ